MAPDKLHGVGTVYDRTLQLSFPLPSSVSRVAKLNPELYKVVSKIFETGAAIYTVVVVARCTGRW
jgi:hypothetical protein